MSGNLHIQSQQLQFSDAEHALFKVVAEVSATLQFPCYVVGGFVRDKILGRDYKKDIDFVCVGSGIALARAVAATLPGKPSVAEFKNFGTAHFRYHGMEIEFVGARKESYRHDSRKPIVEDGTLRDDQLRRDFTINALAISLNENDYGAVIDPFNGIHDMEDRCIRTPLDPAITFSDDPLRMLRAIRFASQLNFDIEYDTYAGIKASKDRIRIISQERITDELNKILLSPKPSIGLYYLSDSGLLEIIFPELYAMHGTDMIDGQGHKDNFFHTLEVVDNISALTDDLWLRWAALLHDIAKPATKKFIPPTGWTFHGHEVVGARMAKQIFTHLKLPLQQELKRVQNIVGLHMRPISLTKENVTDSAIRRLLFEAGGDLEGLLLLCHADITTKNRLKIKKYHENFELVKEKLRDVEARDHIRNFQPPVTGELIMETFDIKPGKEVGQIKEFVREAILEGDIPNEYDAAYRLMLEKGLSLGLQPVKR
ncbi:MAG TPA: HD domain-containing protein [Chitinophagales bacterium]|nr:HD domain-containing protein [Chitinophagales bacterium]